MIELVLTAMAKINCVPRCGDTEGFLTWLEHFFWHWPYSKMTSHMFSKTNRVHFNKKKIKNQWILIKGLTSGTRTSTKHYLQLYINRIYIICLPSTGYSHLEFVPIESKNKINSSCFTIAFEIPSFFTLFWKWKGQITDSLCLYNIIIMTIRNFTWLKWYLKIFQMF